MNALELDGSPTATRARRAPALSELTLEVAPGRVRRARRRLGDRASRRCCGLACGLVPHFHGGTLRRAARRSAAWTCASTGRRELARAVGTLFQDPETQVVMGRSARELAFPLENRGESAVAAARGVEEVALALGHRGAARPRDRRRSRAASSSASRSAPRSPGARGCSRSTSRPRSLTRSPATSCSALLRRLNEEWGTAILLAEHRLERCLGAADRVIALERGALVCDAAPGGFLDWAHSGAPSLETPGAPLLAVLGLSRRRR